MKKFAVNYLLTPYLKYGSISKFVFSMCLSVSILSSLFIDDYVLLKTIQLISMITSLANLFLISIMWIKIDWEDMNNEQKNTLWQ